MARFEHILSRLLNLHAVATLVCSSSGFGGIAKVLVAIFDFGFYE